MSHRHTQPLNPPRAGAHGLPNKAYGALVGTIDGALDDGDDNHVMIPLRIASGQFAGRYKMAFNTESTDPSDGNSADEYYVYDEPITMADVPSEGFTADASLSYSEIGLKQSDFKTVENGKLRTIVHDSAQDSDLVSAYGFTFPGGIHDIHYNNGEPAGSHFHNQPQKDGALAFYTLNRSGETTRRWIFIKFQSQTLP